MGKKYIIELEKEETAYKTVDDDGRPLIQILVPKSYTEPDLEQVRKEAYADGYKTAKIQCGIQAEKDMREVGQRHYQRGLSDAWAAARKICTNWVLSDSVLSKIFGMDKTIDDIMKENKASEAIEKIRQYEQEKEKKDGVWIASETWIMSEANEPSVDTTLICPKCGYEIKIKPHETPALNFCPKCGDCKKPKEEES